MTKRIGGFRRKTRNKLKKNIREKGKLSLTRYFNVFNINDTVLLKAEPSIQGGMYFPRFHGKSGKVIGKKGACYQVAIRDGGKGKVLVVHPVHLRKLSMPSTTPLGKALMENNPMQPKEDK